MFIIPYCCVLVAYKPVLLQCVITGLFAQPYQNFQKWSQARRHRPATLTKTTYSYMRITILYSTSLNDPLSSYGNIEVIS